MTPHLRELASDLFVADHPLVVGGLHLGARTTIVRLGSGGLLVHSPGPPHDSLHRDVEKLGPVVALVAPNKMHHLFLPAWTGAFPEARTFGAPGLAAKLPSIRFDEELGNDPPSLFGNDLDPHVIQGAPRLEEVVFLHRSSRTLLLTDLAFHLRHSESRFTRIAMRLNGGYGHFGTTRLLRSTFRDRNAARISLDHVLGWDFDRVIVAHGDVLDRGGREALRQAYAWL
jgi:hypothetical protein